MNVYTKENFHPDFFIYSLLDDHSLLALKNFADQESQVTFDLFFSRKGFNTFTAILDINSFRSKVCYISERLHRKKYIIDSGFCQFYSVYRLELVVQHTKMTQSN